MHLRHTLAMSDRPTEDYALRIEGHLPIRASDHQNLLAGIKIQLPRLCILLLRCESD